MKPFILFIPILFCFTQAFALDQIILKNGDFLEGKIFSEVPTDHYDIELTCGAKKRVKIKEIEEVKRDLTSNQKGLPSNDSSNPIAFSQKSETGNDSSRLGFFLAPQVGVIIPLSGGSVLFQYGAKIGFDLSRSFSLGYSYRHSQSSDGYSLSGANNVLTLQGLFKNIGDSGFYVGPQIGVNFAKVSVAANDMARYVYGSQSFTIWDAGLDLGYEFALSPIFSLGPDINYDHFFPVDGSDSGNALSIMVVGSFHFH